MTANNRLVGFPMKIFIKADETSKEIPPARPSHHFNNIGSEVCDFYKKVISTEEVNPDPPPVSEIPPSTSPHDQCCSITQKPLNQGQLFKLVLENDVTTLKTCLKDKSMKMLLTKSTDRFGWSALMIASCAGHRDTVKILLKAGADTLTKDRGGNSAFALASKKGHHAVMDLLVAKQSSRSRDQKEKGQSSTPIQGTKKIKLECDLCNVNFSSSRLLERHLASTVHLFKVEEAEIQARGGKVQAHFSIPRHNRGFQMMLSTGWDQNSGLGPKGEGKLYPVKTVLKKDRRGVGAPPEAKEKSTTSVSAAAKVTHFGPNDPRSVQGTCRQTTQRGRFARESTQTKVRSKARERSDRAKEIDFRREFI